MSSAFKPGDKCWLLFRCMPSVPCLVVREQDDPDTSYMEWILQNPDGEEIGPVPEILMQPRVE